MVDIPGDATPDEIEELMVEDLRQRLAVVSETTAVQITQAQAAHLLELLGPSKKKDDEAPSIAVASPHAGSTQPPPSADAPKGKAAAAHAAPAGKLTRAQLNDMTKEELVEYADDHDIEVTQSWPKADIVDAIAKHK